MTVEQNNYQFDYMAIPDEFHDNWTAKLSGDQYKIMVYLLGRLVVSNNPLFFTINGLIAGTGVGYPKIEKELRKLSEMELLNLALGDGQINREEPIRIGSRFIEGNG